MSNLQEAIALIEESKNLEKKQSQFLQVLLKKR